MDEVALTGSTEVGKKIVRAASGNFEKVPLELGGKSPQVMIADADMDAAIPGVANGFLFDHGRAGTLWINCHNAFDLRSCSASTPKASVSIALRVHATAYVVRLSANENTTSFGSSFAVDKS